jgi:hypothetical protein
MMVSMDRALPLVRVRIVLALAALAAVLAASIGIALLLDSESDPATQVNRPVGSFAGHGPSYSSLKELAAHSELVVVGTVTSSGIGKVFDDDPTGEYPTRLLHTAVGIEESLRGSIASDEVTIVTDELAFAAPNLTDWREPGTRVLLFLTPSTETTGYYVLTNLNNTQTAYFVQGDDLEAAVGDPLSGRVAAMSLSEIRREVQQTP